MLRTPGARNHSERTTMTTPTTPDGGAAPRLTLSHTTMVIALQMIGHQHEAYDVIVDVLDPRQRVIQSVHNEAPALLSDIGQGFLPLTLNDASFEEPGRYTVRISSEGRVVASRPLILEQAAAA